MAGKAELGIGRDLDTSDLHVEVIGTGSIQPHMRSVVSRASVR